MRREFLSPTRRGVSVVPYLQSSEARVALFIDGESLNEATKALGSNVDFRKLLDVFGSQSRLLRAHYYALVPPREFVAIKPLLDWLSFNGYSVTEKPLKERGSNGHARMSGSIAIELTIDALQTAPHVDTIVLVTGDCRYRPLVSEIQMRGVRVIAVSTRAVRPAVISDELVRQVDEFVELADLLPQISMSRSPREAVDAG
jgi:uncharacterized LabA/DUF88 family protein